MACGLNCVWAWLNVAALWLAFSAACGGVAGLAASGILHTRVGFWCRDGTSAWIDRGSAVATQWTSGWIVGALVGGAIVLRCGKCAPSFAKAALELCETAVARLLASAVAGAVFGGLGLVQTELEWGVWVTICHAIALAVGMVTLILLLCVPAPNFGLADEAKPAPMLHQGAGDSQL